MIALLVPAGVDTGCVTPLGRGGGLCALVVSAGLDVAVIACPASRDARLWCAWAVGR